MAHLVAAHLPFVKELVLGIPAIRNVVSRRITEVIIISLKYCKPAEDSCYLSARICDCCAACRFSDMRLRRSASSCCCLAASASRRRHSANAKGFGVACVDGTAIKTWS